MEPTPIEVSPIPTPEGPKRLELAFEVQPWRITQPWGIKDPRYEKYGYSRHSGIDIAHGYNSRLRAPFDCTILGTQYQTGGGRVLSILSDKEWLVDDEVCFVRLDYLHLAKYIETEGFQRKGTLLAIQGNTGVETTNPHTHMKATRVKKSGDKLIEIDRNDADNTFNQGKFYTGEYAVDFA